ncbi:hypothetical protein SAMN05443575_2310 [Jatrophihabitans endophyticus]|uniref:Uncharacterized protein n=1 Tax=Jatrophihabitans endophyticus TaxID=1206085 RepID=A0A1M5KZU8_9ACTN|nr:hypothetical protein [Jatrophihabitans endophyticus]SHG58344.1 hypothetical protein SAMN05443575_2310 [Jatrophihabitans endophyticus]
MTAGPPYGPPYGQPQPPQYGHPPAPPYGPPYGQPQPPQYGPPPGPGGWVPPTGGRPPRSHRRDVLIVSLAVVLTLAGLGAYVGYLLHRKHEDHEIRSAYAKIYALEAGECFVPSGTGTDDRAIRALGSCTDPAASVRVTKIAKTLRGCPLTLADRTMSAVRGDGTAAGRVACVSPNLFIGRCYTQAATPTLLAVVDCADARANDTGYEIAVRRRYGDASEDACGPPPMKTYVQYGREGVICTRAY